LPVLATPANSSCQGSQPVFLPNGNLDIVYWNDGVGGYEVAVSTNGGANFTAHHTVATIAPYSPLEVRSGGILCGATGDRTNGFLYVTSQASVQGLPRIVFTKSTNGGTTWSALKTVSDNPAGVAVFNPAIGVSPDGQIVTITFYDARTHPNSSVLYDLYLAESFDGGLTWQPNIRVSTVSTDVSLAPLTASGYMVGDYMAVAAPTGPDTPAVPIWVDTRAGNPDPFIGRVGISSNITFQAWRAARFSSVEIQTPGIGGVDADPDGDGSANLIEYAFGLNPRAPDSPTFDARVTTGPVNPFLIANYQRIHGAADLDFTWSVSTNLLTWRPAQITGTVVLDANPRLDDVSVNSSVGPGPIGFIRLDVSLTPP
jgi:hypothetical protein